MVTQIDTTPLDDEEDCRHVITSWFSECCDRRPVGELSHDYAGRCSECMRGAQFDLVCLWCREVVDDTAF
jgi:hypothetical protein